MFRVISWSNSLLPQERGQHLPLDRSKYCNTQQTGPFLIQASSRDPEGSWALLQEDMQHRFGPALSNNVQIFHFANNPIYSVKRTTAMWPCSCQMFLLTSCGLTPCFQDTTDTTQVFTSQPAWPGFNIFHPSIHLQSLIPVGGHGGGGACVCVCVRVCEIFWLTDLLIST